MTTLRVRGGEEDVYYRNINGLNRKTAYVNMLMNSLMFSRVIASKDYCTHLTVVILLTFS